MDKLLVVLLLVAVQCSNASYLAGRYGCWASPNFPLNYPDGASTSQRILTSPGTQIELSFRELDIEEHATCGFDYVQITENNGSSRKFCGSRIPASYITQSNEVTVQFHSDGSVNKRGFLLTFVERSGVMTTHAPTAPSTILPSVVETIHAYSSVPASSFPTPTPSPMPACDRIMTSLQGNFSSPGYPGAYPNNALCRYDIIAPIGKRIVLRFADFNLESGYDTLRIDELVNGTLQNVASLTGTNVTTMVFTSTQHTFKLIFRSDGSVVRSGFSAYYHVIDPVVHGGWCPWTQGTPCSVSCGLGYQTITRACNCPAPRNGGSQCVGSNISSQQCYAGICPTTVTTTIVSPTPSPRCQRQSFTSPNGGFTSPNFPGQYPNSANCEYQITVATGKAILINFPTFSVEGHSSCAYDAVTIYEGTSSIGASPSVKLCGDGQKTFRSSGNSVFIVFSSDGSVVKQGFQATYVTVDKTPVGGATVNAPSCGITKVAQSRVIGGTDAAKGAWPWQIGMYQYGSFICGGTLIAPNWVLTASHCVVSSGSVGSPGNFEIIVGDLHREMNDTTEQKHQVERIVAHPNYNGNTINNDIALMKLRTPVMMNDHVNTACIPDKSDVIAVGSPCFITGWGKIKHPGSSHTMLQQAKLPVLNSSICQTKLDALSWGLSITKQMVCAGEAGSIKSGCHGDSGGPYVCPDSTGRYYLHGDVSWGSPQCDTTQAYTVFARVTEFVDWIKQSLRDL